MLLKVKLTKASLPARFVLFTLVICTLVFCPVALQALTQAQITTAMGAGWNLGNQLEANSNGIPSETVWGNPVITQSLITAVKNASFKTIRVPISLLYKIGAAPSYTIDAAWLARIKEVVDYCISAGMYVLLDLHGDGYKSVTGSWLLVDSTNQTEIRAEYKAVWQQLATAFASYDEHLIFESMNEIFDGNYYDPNPALYANLNAYNQIFIDTVRQTGGNNGIRWLLIPGWNTNIDYTAADYGFVMPTDTYRSSTIPAAEKRIMISAHYYSPWEFCGDQSGTITQWGSIATDVTKKVAWCQEDYMEAQLNMMYYKFVVAGYPVVIGEWGVVDKTSADSASNIYRQYFAQTLATDCKKYGAVPVYWDNGHNGDYGFAVFDRTSLAITQQGIITSIMTGIGASVTPGPAPTPTPAPTGPGAKISVSYKCNDTNASTSGIRFSFQVQNDDTITVPLSSVKVRYWYVRDDGKWQSFNCYYAVIGTANITNAMVRIPLSLVYSTADFYTEVGFTIGAGSLSPGANSGEVQITLTKYDNSSYNQTNDYSFNSSMVAYGQNLKITGYVNGILVFGTEPGGATQPTATATSTGAIATITATRTATTSVTATSTATLNATATRTSTTVTRTATATRTSTTVTRTATATRTSTTVTRTATATANATATTTATANATPTSTGGTTCTCAAGCSTLVSITPNFTKDGSGQFCYSAASLGSYINSWNLTTLNVNGVDFTNKWTAKASLPATIGGLYYVYYNSAVTYGHFEAMN